MTSVNPPSALLTFAVKMNADGACSSLMHMMVCDLFVYTSDKVCSTVELSRNFCTYVRVIDDCSYASCT